MKSRMQTTLWICMLCLFLLCGCASKQESAVNESETTIHSEETTQLKKGIVNLTERQKQILIEKGLPEKYDELTDSQKDAIVKIERVLTYLEETYDDAFEYDGYVSGGVDGQYVTAKIANSMPEKYVTVYITYENNQYAYSDNYEEIMSTTEYEKQVADFLADYLQDSRFQVYVEISALSENGDSIVERATGCPVIIIDDVYDEKTVEEAAQALGEWISNMEHKNGGGADFRMFNDKDYSMINEFNYKEYYGKDTLWISVSIDSSGAISTQRY